MPVFDNENGNGFGRAAGDREEKRTDGPVAQKVVFKTLPAVSAAPMNSEIKPVFHKVVLNLQAELGKASLNVGELLKLKEGSVIKLDRMTDENIKILVHETPFAYGEVVVINERFGIRLTAFTGDDNADPRQA